MGPRRPEATHGITTIDRQCPGASSARGGCLSGRIDYNAGGIRDVGERSRWAGRAARLVAVGYTLYVGNARPLSCRGSVAEGIAMRGPCCAPFCRPSSDLSSSILTAPLVVRACACSRPAITNPARPVAGNRARPITAAHDQPLPIVSPQASEAKPKYLCLYSRFRGRVCRVGTSCPAGRVCLFQTARP